MAAEKKIGISMRIVLGVAAMAVSIAVPPPILGAESPNDILIIANRTASEKAISVVDLRAIFLKKRLGWPAGGKAIPIHVKGNPTLKQRFLEIVTDMTEEEEKHYWQKQKVRKGIPPPPEFQDVLKAVFSVKNSVSYIYRHQYHEDVVKVLLVLKK
jgi:hypothetical protein